MQKKSIVILGAGISGLSLAWFLQKQHGDSINITLLEKSNRTGGWIRTIRQDGFLFELGPHSCRPIGSGRTTLELIEELDLQKEVIQCNPEASKRYLFLNQQLELVPRNPLSFLFSPVTRGIIGALINDLRTPASNISDESIYEFVSRRFSKELAERIIDPLTSGIYAGDIRQLSIRSCFPIFHQWEQQHGSVLKGLFKRSQTHSGSPFVTVMLKKSLFSFREGLETLTKALQEKVQPCIKLSAEVKALNIHEDRINVVNADGSIIAADHVFSALPASPLSSLLSSSYPALSESIASIEHASLAIVSLGYRQSILKQKGFGYLVPSAEKEDVLGVIWDSCVFPQQNFHPEETRLTAMLGGAHRPEITGMSDEEILTMTLRTMQKHLGIHKNPCTVHIHRVHQAIPQYTLGHTEKLQYIQQELLRLSPRLTCIGSSFHGVSINDCIAKAKETATKSL